jgi:hypothetical protein
MVDVIVFQGIILNLIKKNNKHFFLKSSYYSTGSSQNCYPCDVSCGTCNGGGPDK